MTQHFDLRNLRFYLTDPHPCPYLPDRLERKMFTPLRGDSAAEVNDALSRRGFRRSQSVAYRPRCPNCAACVSVRAPTAAARPSRSLRRILKRNAQLRSRICEPIATQAHYDLFRRYLDSRHSDGSMVDMDAFDFAAMIEDSQVAANVVEYYDPDAAGGERLVAAALTDVMRDGLSMVYTFFDPELSDSSLGAYMVLDHIAKARSAGLPYVYLGYWIRNARKMAYKARFQPLEGLVNDVWRPMTPQELTPDGPLLTPDPGEDLAAETRP